MRKGRKKRVGVIGSFVWDVIHGRDGRSAPIEEWGGICYALSGLDAALNDEWEIVPIIKVGHDLVDRARTFTRTLKHIAPDAELIEVPYPNNRVELRYYDAERRSEILTGGVPGWNWMGLKPLLDQSRLDALYVNFLSGWEMDLETMMLLRSHFSKPIYCDLHMLVMAVQADGLRVPRPLPDVAAWCSCFDILQVNEDEMAMMAPDPMVLAATSIAAGVSCLCVTLGSKGVIYVAAPGFDSLADLNMDRTGLSTAPRGGRGLVGALRTAKLDAVPISLSGDGDPTGCGDVWGSTCFSRLLSGDNLEESIVAAAKAASKNVEHRGASGLSSFLRGELSGL